MSWILPLCLTNIKRRKARTWLTILGVVIGVISIVSLLALGIGVKQEILADVENESSVTQIQVYGVGEGKRKDKMLTDKVIARIQDLEHVESVYPMLGVEANIKMNQYEAYVQITGAPEEFLQELSLGEGSLPSGESRKPELIFGNQMGSMFYNSVTWLSYEESSGKKKSLCGETMTVQLGIGNDNSINCRLPVVAVTEGDAKTYTSHSYNTYCNIEVLKRYLKQMSDSGKIPGQPVTQNNESYKEWIYSSLIVNVTDTENVDSVVKNLQDMGFQTENDKAWLDSINKTLKIVQILLGGIGMIALVVAVIGIGNTMMTAVYDRIHEIGILKVLGCDMDELLLLFLLEAGIIGGIGGILGIVASYGITELLINRLAVSLIGLQKGTQLAVIPLWLSAVALLFSIILGVLAGFFPAKWAAKLKPIDAVGK